jgi:hypothetical protein
LQHLPRVIARTLGDLRSTQHAREFIDPRSLVEDFDLRSRRPTRDLLRHAELVVRLRSNLRQVRHAQDLAATGEHVQLPTHHLGDGATDAGVDFVEDEAGQVGRFDGGHLERETYAR